MLNVAYGIFTLSYGEGDAAGEMGSDEYVDVWVYDRDTDWCYGCTRAGTLAEAMTLARAYVDKVLHPVPVYYPRGEAY